MNCPWCSGTGCDSCGGTGERAEPVAWECGGCGASGDDAPEKCPKCGESVEEVGNSTDPEDGFDPPEPDYLELDYA